MTWNVEKMEDASNFSKLEDDLNFFQLEDNLIFSKLEDNLIFFQTGRPPQIFPICKTTSYLKTWKTTSISSIMEAALNFW